MGKINDEETASDESDNERLLENNKVLIVLLSIMAFSGILAIVSNLLVVIAHYKQKQPIFERPLLNLAFHDILTGLLGTPIVCCIYYYQCNNSIFFAKIMQKNANRTIRLTKAFNYLNLL